MFKSYHAIVIFVLIALLRVSAPSLAGDGVDESACAKASQNNDAEYFLIEGRIKSYGYHYPIQHYKRYGGKGSPPVYGIAKLYDERTKTPTYLTHLLKKVT